MNIREGQLNKGLCEYCTCKKKSAKVNFGTVKRIIVLNRSQRNIKNVLKQQLFTLRGSLFVLMEIGNSFINIMI